MLVQLIQPQLIFFLVIQIGRGVKLISDWRSV